MMKVALVHDWLTNMGGAERVLCVLRELFPEAPIYTTLFEPEKLADCLAQADVRTSFLQRLPRWLRRHQRLLPWMPYAFEQFDLSGYDLVISSSHACAKGVLTRPETLHVCYCYTPMRYAWDMYYDYVHTLHGPKRWLAAWSLHRIRLWDYISAQRVDRFVAISRSVAARIRKHYGAASSVLAPPVDLSRFRADEPREDYYVVVSRLVSYKRVDLAVEACLRLQRRLLVIGVGPEEEALKRKCPTGADIRFLGWQSEEAVADCLARAKGFLFPGEEDFGLTMVEALASGCPVVAYNRGGALDILRDGETGILFAEQSVAGLEEGIVRLERSLAGADGAFRPERLRAEAERFGKEKFKEAFTKLIEGMV
ncbi:Glycosyltransferase subfamily 4-like, N-terminal domain protein [Acididesulfobacillus acetoxydans]|uniref:Glycosyltransferase n=1 Tax=Acididesulfobacillus acetoxydans TaxID=1561005 RepID=A0A8S0WVF9_9FIRM|nr:glycosyltransferase [Acididesulfobacillus acetoxydans]CAA7599561.1 Glycosyltransferase subfamily 4-like, N-terminal domain protein [Acididesulfobacillus acetoxydans]CEJ07756.1 Glycosyltransferase [Acididesulfobacillus acetoxydans]